MDCKAVLFDLDGTLLDTLPDFAPALNHALTACGFPARALGEFNHIIGGGIRHGIRLALPAAASDADAERVHTEYQRYYAAHCCEHTRPYDGIPELLATLEKRGVALAVLTNKTECLAQRIIRQYFPDIHFRLVWGNLEPRPLKPLPDAGMQMLDALGLRPEEAAYVGDSDTDIRFAQACGMLPVGAVWGYRGREELADAGAVRLADSPAELAALL